MKAWPPFPERVKLAAVVEPLLVYLTMVGWRRQPGGSTRVPNDMLELDGEESPTKLLTGEREDGVNWIGSTLGRALTVAFRLGVEQGKRLAHVEREDIGAADWRDK